MNGENAAGGVGITEKTARELLETGADAITLGNHAYRHREVYGFLDREERIVRPANYPKGSPGHGHTVIEQGGERLGVINLSGQVFLDAVRSPFAEADALLAELRGRAAHVLVDMHAEATSEKVAMGWHLDGRATACLGTHTHVPTADARVLPGGTAYVTDVGMTGARGGVIGVKREQAHRALHDAHQRPLRDRRRGSLAERGASRGGRRGPRDGHRAAARAAERRRARIESASTASSTRSRNATRAIASGSRATTSK